MNDLQWIVGKTIDAFYLKRDKHYNNNIVSIYLLINNKSLVLEIDQETDEIQLNNFVHMDKNYKQELGFNNLFVNKKIISFWFPVNNLGYSDTFILGLDKFIPTHLFVSTTSHINICLAKIIE